MVRIAEVVQLTDTGRQREANEDSFFSRAPLFAVADGMGGAQAGEVASRVAVEAFEAVAGDELPPEELLKRTAQSANRRIFDLAQTDTARSGMGTTLTAALIKGDEISFGHVGDSRAYLFRDGRLRQITNDHSLVEELRRQGKLTREQAAEHPQRSVITRALGPEPQVQVDTMTLRVRPGDVFLLCSDGLTTMLTDEDVLAILTREGDLERTGRRLIRAANDRGGRDNITVVLFRLESSDAPAAEEGATLVGPSAEEAGFSAEAVRAGVRDSPPAPPTRRTRARAASTSRRAEPSGGRRGRRALRALAGLLVLAVVVVAAVFGIRQIWFLGVDDAGKVGLYRGLPYDLPLGIELYSEVAPSAVTLAAIPEDRRDVAVDHELRSRGDAESLIADLESSSGVESVKGFIEGSGSASGGRTTTTETTTPKGTATTTRTTTVPDSTSTAPGGTGGGGG